MGYSRRLKIIKGEAVADEAQEIYDDEYDDGENGFGDGGAGDDDDANAESYTVTREFDDDEDDQVQLSTAADMDGVYGEALAEDFSDDDDDEELFLEKQRQAEAAIRKQERMLKIMKEKGRDEIMIGEDAYIMNDDDEQRGGGGRGRR